MFISPWTIVCTIPVMIVVVSSLLTDSHNDHPLIGSKCNIQTTHFLPTASEVTIEPSSHSCLGACKGLRRRGRLILNIKIVEDYNGGDLYQKHLYQKHKGILVDTYASMRDSEIKHCQSWREHYYATEAEIKRRGKVTVKPPQRIDMHEAIVAERCETFVSKEMARMPVPLKMAIRTENSRPEITGAGIANLRSTWDRRTMARPQK